MPGLVGYSDESGSDSEPDAPLPVAKPKLSGLSLALLAPKHLSPASSSTPSSSSGPSNPISGAGVSRPKPVSVARLTDRSNPKKIVVSFSSPGSAITNESDGSVADRPAKKAKTGGFGGLNAILPAPKNRASSSLASSASSRAGGLKTGGAAFSRDAASSESTTRPLQQAVADEAETEAGAETNSRETAEQTVPAEPKEKATIFRPLSLGRGKRKGRMSEMDIARARARAMQGAPAQPSRDSPSINRSWPANGDAAASPVAPKFDLGLGLGTRAKFAEELVEEPDVLSGPSTAKTTEEAADEHPDDVEPPDEVSEHTAAQPTLDMIATDLGLSKSARRQLFGRNGVGGKVQHFDAAVQYQDNEVRRQSGEAIYNPVRSIRAGKHSLMQLVGQANGQKDALEERFAEERAKKGKRPY